MLPKSNPWDTESYNEPAIMILDPHKRGSAMGSSIIPSGMLRDNQSQHCYQSGKTQIWNKASDRPSVLPSETLSGYSPTLPTTLDWSDVFTNSKTHNYTLIFVLNRDARMPPAKQSWSFTQSQDMFVRRVWTCLFGDNFNQVRCNPS